MPNKTTTASRVSVLKTYLESLEDEIMEKLYVSNNKLDDISRADLTGRLAVIKDIKNVCEERGRY